MSQDRTKPGVTVVTAPWMSDHHDSGRQKKHRRGMSIKVAPANTNSPNRIKMVHSVQENRNNNSNKGQKLSYDSNLEEIISVSAPYNQYRSETFSTNSNTSYPRLMTTSKNKRYPISMTSSFNQSYPSFDNNDDAFMNEPQTKPIEKNDTDKRNRRRSICGFCPPCSTCCWIVSIIGCLLFLAGLLVLTIFLLPNESITTIATTITSTSATTSSDTTTTTTTLTTSTTTTSSTSSTSTTSSTTTTTTPMPPCIPSFVGSSSTLYTTSSGSLISYTCFAYALTSPTTGAVTLAFQFRNDPSYWYLDDVSVYAGGNQMLINGGFETGSFSPWILTGSCGGSPGAVSNLSPRSGTYCYRDGSNGCADQVSQQFTATAGQVYVVSFWLKSGSTGSIITAAVTLS